MLTAGSLPLKKKRMALVWQPGEASEGRAGMKGGGVRDVASDERWVVDEWMWDGVGGGINQLARRNFCSLPPKQAVT